MKSVQACTQVATNSANATLVAATTACQFIGANIGGGVGTLNIYAGTDLFLVLKTTADNDTVPFSPSLPVALSTGLNATCSGTGVCTLFFVKNV